MVCTIAAETMDPVPCSGGLNVVPDMTLDQAEGQKWDAILLPGGAGARPWLGENTSVQEFLKRKVPETEYVWTGERMGEWSRLREQYVPAHGFWLRPGY